MQELIGRVLSDAPKPPGEQARGQFTTGGGAQYRTGPQNSHLNVGVVRIQCLLGLVNVPAVGKSRKVREIHPFLRQRNRVAGIGPVDDIGAEINKVFDAGADAGFEGFFGGLEVVGPNGNGFALGADAAGVIRQMHQGFDPMAAQQVVNIPGYILPVHGNVMQGQGRRGGVESHQPAAAGQAFQPMQQPGANVTGGSGNGDNFAGRQHQE